MKLKFDSCLKILHLNVTLPALPVLQGHECQRHLDARRLVSVKTTPGCETVLSGGNPYDRLETVLVSNV